MKKILSFILFSFATHLAWAQSGAGYDPVNPPDPDVYYTLMLEASPRSGGTVSSNDRQKLSAGQSTYVSASPRLGYEFKQWMMGDSLVSNNSGFYFTMPEKDVVLTAYFEWNPQYDPINPDDPDAEGYSHHVYVYASPSAGGYFNSSSFTLIEGKTTNIYAYPREGYRFESWMCNGEVVSTDNPLSIKMGTADIAYTATFVYNPVSPGEPSPNVFNSATGEVIIDNFTPGSLNNAIYTAIGSSENYSLVQSILVIGRMTSSDFGFARGYNNCALIDLSRTTGYMEIPSYSFEGAETLKSLYLPMNVERVGENAFKGCTALKHIYLYATTPPVLADGALEGLDKSVTIHVPSASVALYAAAEGWSMLTIQSLDENEKSITVSLPGAAGEYKNMTLELQNMQSGQVYRCLVTERTSYTFFGLMKNTYYNIYLKNSNGVVLGEINNVALENTNLNISFENIQSTHDVALKVVTPDGADVTANVTITWLDEQGSYLRQGNKVSELLTGTNIQYRVKLNKELAMEYVQPVDMVYQVTNGENAIVITLSPMKQIAMSGYVKDAATKQGISGATVSISQTLNGKYFKTIVAKTDSKGYYTATVYNAPTSLAVSAYDYVNQTTEVAIDPSVENVTVDDIAMASIIGATINVSLTYTPSVAEGETAETQNWYDDYQNVAYSIYNLTTGKEVTQVSNRYPQLVVLDGAKIGDRLKLTARSKKDAFMPVTVVGAVDSTNRVNLSVPITQYGGIRASFEHSSNSEVVGILYDGKGYLINAFDFDEEAVLSVPELKDGEYTLITMGKDSYFNSIYSLSQLPNVGLIKDVDYCRNDFAVTSGVTQVANAGVVPELDTSKYKYIGDGTTFTVNKTSIVAGNYLTFSSSVDFFGEYVSAISGVELIVDIPESASFVDNSLLVGSSVSEYSLEGNRISIPLNNYHRKDNVRFCVIPKVKGSYAPSAFVRFMVDNEEKIVAVGAAKYDVESFSIIVPKTVVKKDINVRGTSLPGSKVEIFDNDIMIAQLETPADGSWKVSCELANAYNLSTHPIFAKVTTGEAEILSETQECYYDVSANGVKTVTMTHYNAYYKKNMDVVYDMESGTTTPSFYYFYTAADYSFIVDFINNDTSAIANVNVYAFDYNGKPTRLTATYDSKINKWIAKHNFSSSNAPVNVSVDYDVLLYGPVSRQAIVEAKFDYNNYTQEVDIIKNEVESLLASTTNLTAEEFEDKFVSLFGTSASNSSNDIYNLSVNDLLDKADILLAQSDALLDEDNINSGWKYFINQTEFGTIDLFPYGIDGTIVTEIIGDITPEYLIELGFNKIEIDDNSEVYELITDETYVVVDFASNTYTTLSYNNKNNINQTRRASNSSSNDIQILIDQTLLFEKKVSDLVDMFGIINEVISKIPEFFNNKIWEIDAHIATNRDIYQALRQSITQDMPAGQVGKITEKVEKLIQENCKLGQEKRLLNETLKKLGPAILKITSAVSALCSAYRMGNNLREYIDLWYSVPYCGCNPERTTALQNSILNSGLRCAGKDLANIVGDMVLLNTIINSARAARVSGGQSLIVTATSIGLAWMKWKVNDWSNNVFKNERAKYNSLASALRKDKSCKNCSDPERESDDPEPPMPKDPEPPKSKDPEPPIPNNEPTTINWDPSGYVYEGVSSNRLQGVTATAYYMETTEDMYGVLHDEPKVWDAEEYAQENPLFTDENGMYQWDVPQGLWQVKFEKEGYETTYSDWLPVPPPQLDVNIAMTQARQPEVKEAHAYEAGVEITFDKYMQPAYLTADNILVSQGGEYVNGEMQLMDEETAYEDENVKYASRVRFVPETPFASGEVTLVVSNRVRSYANIQMQDTYTQTFDIEKEVKEIVADEKVKVPYEGTKMITVKVLPADAAAGKTLHAESASSMLATISQSDVVISETGEAQFEVTGELPGATAITFSIDGVQVTASTIVNIEIVEGKVVQVPQASLASGISVYSGTTVTLSAEEGQKIWYTLDGSCPCDENGTRQLYTEPLTISGDVTVKMMAEDSEGDVSEVVTLTYSILQSKDGVALNDGWTWVSFNMKNNEALASTNSALASGTWTASDVIKDNQYVDMYSAAQHKWIGTMSKHGKLTNAGMYKIHSSQAQKLGLTGEAVHPLETNISISAGWNYISYVPLVSMSVANALSRYEAQDGDVIKSQDAFSTYSTTNGWEGDLTNLDAGKGYMLKRNTSGQTSFCYPIPSTNSTPSNAKKEGKAHRYADNMNIVGEIYGITVEDGDSLIAYVGGEVRGASRLINGKKVFLTIHGDHDATVALVLQRDGEIIATANDMIDYKSNEVVGTGDVPTAITFSSESVNTGNAIGNIKAIYSMNGMKMGTKRLNAVPAGAYIIYSEIGGNTHITKLIKQ